MSMIVFLLEERSAQEMLNGILPTLLSNDISYRCIPFDGKQDLEKNLEKKIKNWKLPDTKFVIIRDQDSEDCHEVKKRLFLKCKNAGHPDSLIRIACHELESFYLGDLEAISQAYDNIKLPSQNSRKFRSPDSLANPAEELKKITKLKYQKLLGSRKIAPYLKLDGSNCSTSFNALLDGIRRICC